MPGKVITLCLVLVALGCAPSLGKTLRIDRIPLEVEPRAVEHIRGQAKVRVENFIDSRRDPAIAEIDGRMLTPEGDPVLSVQRIIERHLKANGIVLSIFGSETTISGAITKWQVVVSPGFPMTTVDAVAEVAIDVSNRGNVKVYSGRYTGSTTLRHPFPTKGKIEDLLTEAMSHAVGEAMADQALIDRLYQEASLS